MERRTSIVLNDRLLREAQEVLGTRGVKDTVHRALREAVNAARRRRLARLLREGRAFDFEEASIDRSGQWRG